MDYAVTCDRCGGKMFIEGLLCDKCHGDGRVLIHETEVGMASRLVDEFLERLRTWRESWGIR
jgi:hypothetical protein